MHILISCNIHIILNTLYPLLHILPNASFTHYLPSKSSLTILTHCTGYPHPLLHILHTLICRPTYPLPLPHTHVFQISFLANSTHKTNISILFGMVEFFFIISLRNRACSLSLSLKYNRNEMQSYKNHCNNILKNNKNHILVLIFQ